MPFHWSIPAKTARISTQVCVSVLLATGVWAQTSEVHRSGASGASVESATSRRAAVQKKSRFLGWKFAARSAQGVPGQRHQAAVAETIGGEVRKPAATQLGLVVPESGSSFANAGFLEREPLPTGYIPTAIVEGDFNEDGHMDVAISNGGDNTVYVLLGKGDGTFQLPEILYTQGQAPTWITAVSLRNNGHLDLAVTDGDSNSVEVFLGKGDGTFQPGVQVVLPQTPTFVLAGDFNKDGKPDLAIGLTIDQALVQPQFEILLGDGAGGFTGSVFPPAMFASLDGPVPTGWLASGDLNKDGYLDLVTTITGGEAITYLNQAGRSFSKGAPFGPNDVPMVVALGDMDEDGCLDAVELGTLGHLTIAKGTCDGNFTQGNPTALVGDIDPAVKVVDVNGDGHLDVVASSANYGLGGPGYGAEGGYLVSVLKGDGHGNLTPPQIYRAGADIFSLVVADFTGDHKPEIVTVDSGENRASVFLNDGNGNYGDPQGESIGYLAGVTNAPNPTIPMQIADLNGDGKPDLYLVEEGTNVSPNSQLTVMLNDGTGKFLPPVRSPLTAGLFTLQYAAGVFRSGQKADLVYVTVYQPPFLAVFLPGNGDGTFGAPVPLVSLPNPEKVVKGDFNHDGKLDFAVYGTDNSTKLELDVFLGQGDGTFKQLAPQTFPDPGSNSPQQIFALDLNHDGKLDILVGNNSNGGWTDSGDDLVEILGNGDGTFQAPKILIAHFGAVAIADVNRDGFPDLIQGRDPTEDVGKTLFGTPGVTVYLGTPNGTFVQQPTYALPGVALPSLDPVLVGDFNGDGIPDIGYRYFTGPQSGLTEPRLRVLQGVGDGTFIVTGHFYQLPAVSDPFAGADFHGNGTTDLVELVGYTSSFHTIPAAAPPSLDIALDSSPIVGSTGSATVTLEKPAAGSETVLLSASDPAVQLPGSLHFAAGQQTQDFSFTLGAGLDRTHVLALYATLGAETAVAYTSTPNPNAAVGVAASLLSKSSLQTIKAANITPGESLLMTLQLDSVGGYYGTFGSFQCNGLPAGASCTFADPSIVVRTGTLAQTGFTVSASSSTPFGTYPVQVISTDGHFQAFTTLQLGIGDFALTISPSTIVIGPSGTADPIVTSTSTNGLSEFLILSCSNLPAGARCGQNGNLSANSGSTGLSIGGGPIAAKDYPFQITGATTALFHHIDAILRVGDFTASLDKTSATLSAGQSATFNVTLASINHYASSISVFCQSPTTSVTCMVSPLPASLTDNGTLQVQLTVKAAAAAAQWRRFDRERTLPAPYVLAFLLSIGLLFLRRRSSLVPGFATILILTSALACGGGCGSISGGGSTPTPPPASGPPSAQMVTLPVTALAAITQSDSLNQKSLGPIVITVH
jgi:hypothetical protein